MRFMSIIKAAENQGPPPKALMEAMGRASVDEMRSGRIVDMGGLAPSAMGARVRVQGGRLSVIDGPFSEAKEIIGGYWLIQCKSKEEALAWATRAPMEDGATIELRQVHDMEDFPPEVRALTEDFAASRS